MIGVGEEEHTQNVLNRISSQIKDMTEFISKIERTPLMSKKTVRIFLYGVKAVLLTARTELIKLNKKLKEMEKEMK